MGPRGRAGRLERDRRDEAERELGPHARRHGARLRVEARVPGLALGRVEERADARADEDAEVVARAARPRVAALEHGRAHDAHERAVDLEVVLAPVEDDGDVVPRVVVDDDVAVHGADPADVVERAPRTPKTVPEMPRRDSLRQTPFPTRSTGACAKTAPRL